VHQDFHGINLGEFGGHFNCHIPKTTNFIFSQNSHQAIYLSLPHRQTWPCAKPTQLKTFVHQDFHGIHLGAFGGHSNFHIIKTTNFTFSQNSPPSHLAKPCHTPKLGDVQDSHNSKLFVHEVH